MSEPTYPCIDCGAPRTKQQGGNVFTVCDDCWNKSIEWHAPRNPPTVPRDARTDLLDRFTSLTSAATPGPWIKRGKAWEFAAVHDERGGEVCCLPYERTSDADLIVAMRNNIDALLAVVKAASEWRETIRARPLAHSEGPIASLADTLIQAVDALGAVRVDAREGAKK